ncbi:hypothetical protein GCM10028807_32580 [Spirosoma daeguense]
MLDQLEQITSQLSALSQSKGGPAVLFGYGTRAQLNVLADLHEREVLLFHEGYLQSQPRILTNGAFQRVYQLTLFLFIPSALSDKPEQKRAHIDLLAPISMRLYQLLDNAGIINNANESANFSLNLTDRNLDGIRLTLSLTLDALSLC